jgi:hypothetical protein
MEGHLLHLLHEMIISSVDNGKNDVRDFLSCISIYRRLYHLSHDERYWQLMVSRRDPTNKKPSENMLWLDYCKQSNVYSTRELEIISSN